MACFVAAGAGACVAKHGNVKASATSGAFDTLGALGLTTGLNGPGVEQCLADAGIAFVFAKAFHPAMRHAGPVRAQLGVPTVMNILGPLSHPGRIRRQVIGVSDPGLQDLMAGVLANRGSEHAWVVHGHGRLDEIALTGPSRVVEVKEGAISEFEVDPTDLGIARASLDDISGGDAKENAKIAHAIFDGSETGPRRDIVVLNAAAGLVVAG
ncbi:MAG: anthranilate phosphoribosyltransferase, partial [Actinobacteria bacterium]|nr:anthranilate phosphoribosyltransferase [Actinomycetota bacterium]